jgi:uncharacterized protein
VPFKNITQKDLFECQRCGDCCKGYGGTFVTPADIERIADYIGTPKKKFVATYCRMSGGKPLLSQRKDGYCIFWDGLCTIHPVKPRMCRQWPFIESVLIDPSNWAIMASFCPGIRTNFPLEVVIACVSKELKKTGGSSARPRNTQTGKT